MNTRLLSYLRSLGLKQDATDAEAWEFYSGLRGNQRAIANNLNYVETDTAARTSCDVAVRALGYDPAEPTKLLAVETPQRTQPGGDGLSLANDQEQAVARGVAQERARVTEIRQLCGIANCSDEFTQSLIADGAVTVDQARERIFADHQARSRAEIETDLPNPSVHSRNSVTGLTQDVLEAAMLQRSGIDPTQNWVRDVNGVPTRRRAQSIELERAADAAYQFRQMSIEDFMRAAARIDGVQLPHGRAGLLQFYCESVRSFSTSALSAIFTTNVNSQLLGAYETAEDSTTGGWIRESDVSDFKTNERARMVNGGALDKLPRGSEANHANYEDVVETFKIARYAKQFAMDDQDVQDDMFAGHDQFIPADMGVAARQLRPDLIYSILMGNPNMRDSAALFVDATHGNLKASSALGTAGKLEAARKAMRIQTENGRNLNIMAKFLIVPPALEDTADVLVNSRLLITGESATKPENNPNANKGLVVVVDARLENGVTDPTDPTGATVHAGSATSWFLSAVAAAHTIECAYLRGTGRVPQVRPFVLTQGRWGIGWDVKMDIGAKALDWRGLLKATG